MEAKTMPHDADTERNVLGTLIRYNEYFNTYGDMLTPDLFYEIKAATIFRAVEAIVTSGGVTDINSIASYLQQNPDGLVIHRNEITDIAICCSEKTLRQDVERLRILSNKRKAWQVLAGAAAKILEPYASLEEELENVSEGLSDINQVKEQNVCTFADALNEVSQIVNDNLQGQHNFIQTGFKIFDERYIFRPRSLTILAAFPAVGKTALAMNVVLNVARQGIPCAFYSLEMGKSEIAARVVAKRTEATSSRILNAKLSRMEMERLSQTIKDYRDLPIYIDESGSADFMRTLRSIRNMVKRHGVKLVVLDYLQIYTQTGNSSEESLGKYAREAKNIARELNIAVLVLSQLNRSAAHPTIRMLRGSGQIEESADNVVLIDRPEAYPDSGLKYEGEFSTESTQGTAKLTLAKGRGVGTGSYLVKFDGLHTRFYEEVEEEKDLPFAAPDEEGSEDYYDNMYHRN